MINALAFHEEAQSRSRDNYTATHSLGVGRKFLPVSAGGNLAHSYIVPAAGDANTYATTTSDATAFP
jgi:hypothetical protein